MGTRVNILLPEHQSSGQIGVRGPVGEGALKTLYLLHGLSDDCSTWQRRTSIERYAADLPLLIVMPEVHRSFYTDMQHGPNYFRFLSEELPAVIEKTFNPAG